MIHNNEIICIIPLRLNSSRFPEKVIKNLEGMPMFVYIYKNLSKCPSIKKIYISTKDTAIIKLCKLYQIDYIKNLKDHDSGTSRIIEAIHLQKIQAPYILNVQGDEPLMDYKTLEFLMKKSQEISLKSCSTLMKAIDSKKWYPQKKNKNCVKLLVDKHNKVIEFFRFKDLNKKPKNCFEHIGVYFYHREALKKIENELFNKGHLQNFENLEQVNFMNLGIPIYTFKTNSKTISIDTEEDFEELISYLAAKKKKI